MSTEERIKALEVAMQNEARERQFYLKHGERTANPLGKKMFRSLADDEKEHMERIRDLHDRLKNQGRWPEDLPIEVKGTKIKDVLKTVLASMEEAPAPARDRDDIEAVKLAIDFEEKGRAYYEDLEKKTDNPVEKDFFRFLASMEHDHLMSLKDSLEFFENPEGWYTAKERHTIDGGTPYS
jgi:rubrerythrin